MSRDSLDRYKRLVSVDPSYIDRSGLFEIIESIYFQLSISNPYFNAYVEYGYYNVIKTHILRFFKQINLEKIETISELNIYYSRNLELISILELNLSKDDDKVEKEEYMYKLNSSSFDKLKDFIESWFNKIIINVINKDKNHE